MAKRAGGTVGERGGAARPRATGRGTRGQGRRRQATSAEEEGLMETARGLGEDTAEAARRAASRASDAASEAAERGEEAGRQVVGWVRDNPWPTLLIGAGAAWLAIDAVRGREAEGEMQRRPTERTEEGRGAMSRTMSNAADLGRRSVSTVAGAGRDAGEQVSGFVRENPMWAGLAALGIGLAVGMTLPSTMAENRMLGDAREAVVRRARQVADSASETVREVGKSASRIAGATEGGRRG